MKLLFQNSRIAAVGGGAIVAFLLVNLVHLTHGEQTPTYLDVERARTVSRYGAIPLYWFNLLISPIIKLGDWVAKSTLRAFGIEMTGAWLETEEDIIESQVDLRKRLGSVLDRGDLSEERRQEVMNALQVGEQPVRDIMIPSDEIVALSTAVDVEENVRRLTESPHTRYPLVGEELTDFQGIIYVPVLAKHLDALASGEIDFETVAAPTMTLSPDVDVSDAIDQFQTERQELALVIEDGDVVGLVTVTDLLESVVGDVEDPIDRKRSSTADE